MSLPRYIVNLDEIAFLLNSMKDGSEEPESIYNKGKQKTKGMRLSTSGEKLEIFDRWVAPNDIWITGVKIGVGDNVDLANSTIDLFINREIIFESVYLKNISEYKNFRIFKPVKEDEIIEVILHGQTENIEIWVDIDYIGEIGGLTTIQPPPPPPIEPELEPIEPIIPTPPPNVINPDDVKPPVVVCPSDIARIGEINIVSGNTQDLVITMEFSEISGHAFPDLNVEAPNGDTFGFEDMFLSTRHYDDTRESSSCSLATYTGFESDPETYVFKNPMVGKWRFFAQSIGGRTPSLVRFDTSHSYLFNYEFRECIGFEGYPLKPF